ncbi:MAG: radical SAM protein [Deltaproteobacteria bacterium]|nr:radical SAM protein [Deltaproteobacteria bacterium]
MAKDYIDNPAALKIDLMLRGLRIDDPLVKAWACGVDGIDIMLPHNTLVNIPCREEFTKGSPYTIRKKDGGYVIGGHSSEVAVSLVPKPKFYERKTSTGIPFAKIASVHGGVTSITPSPRCDFFNANVECKYCAGNLDVKGMDKTVYSVDDVVETVAAVLADGIRGIIYLSTGFSDEPDGGIVFLKPYLQAIKNKFHCLVAVETLPPKENRWIDETYALGADSVLYNLEIYDKELFELICPGRAASIGRKRYMSALEYAARIFPSGTVASHLIVGLEPPGSTIMGVDCLVNMGVVPILPIYRPGHGKALRIDPLTAEIILPVYKHLYKAVKKSNISLNWVKDLSMVTTPAEMRAIVDKTASNGSLIEGFYKSKIGRKAAWGLSSLMRKLRVKKSEEDE